ncbi:hypothetical protein JMF89_07300 [Clostridiaceae bacterium UIB06]|uniref:Uncharacterized protein n=1 Tax=Clostridium thailandense TaxID=2794346 RepID=A0A949X5Q5_9CLOT|nr:hypothetical protein [Clostridium thailandense]MBV7276033.1 hypothetical protein [Clostridium thailandense]MCH5137008.1 hypothetical protein [Clostridiaceae bacterium UIB06]
MKKNYKMKKTISMKMFINEFGENFSEHMKSRLLELEVRSVLTRKEDEYRLDIKHVEHTQHDFDNLQKEYVYGEFLVIDDSLYFSDKCIENNYVIQAPIVDTIYNNLSSDGIILDGDNKAKKIDDNNIDYIVDTLLTVFPDVTQSYLNIISEMISHERN